MAQMQFSKTDRPELPWGSGDKVGLRTEFVQAVMYSASMTLAGANGPPQGRKSRLLQHVPQCA